MFPEGPRWRDGTWWVSDQLDGTVQRLDESGRSERVLEIDAPSGLGFLADGTLGARRTWAELPKGAHPDGLCLDANGDMWVASYLAGEFLHLREGGEVLDRLSFASRWAMSCCLGGDDGRSLLLCTAETSQDDYFAGRSVGHLDVVRVDVPGVGCP